MRASIVDRLRDQRHVTQGDGLSALLETTRSAADTIETLSAASVALRDDMLIRAEINKHLNDGDIIVEAGAGVWSRFCAALDKATDQ
jgi:hypothetical protein